MRSYTLWYYSIHAQKLGHDFSILFVVFNVELARWPFCPYLAGRSPYELLISYQWCYACPLGAQAAVGSGDPSLPAGGGFPPCAHLPGGRHGTKVCQSQIPHLPPPPAEWGTLHPTEKAERKWFIKMGEGVKGCAINNVTPAKVSSTIEYRHITCSSARIQT